MPSVNRMKMVLHNGSTPRISYSANIISNSTAASSSLKKLMPSALNTKMIDRIHSARPGCSACGKK